MQEGTVPEAGVLTPASQCHLVSPHRCPPPPPGLCSTIAGVGPRNQYVYKYEAGAADARTQGMNVSVLYPQNVISPVMILQGQAYVEGLLCARPCVKSFTYITSL